MNPRKQLSLAAATVAVVAIAFTLIGTTSADNGARVYHVKVTNLTKSQVFSPPVLVTHGPSVALFAAGSPASDELAALAENGDGGPLAALLGGSEDVFEVQATGAPIPPGATMTYEIRSKRRFGRFSIAGMLVDTNDNFFAVNSGELPVNRAHGRTWNAPSYDAGSEANNEGCGFIPGPSCPAGSGNARDTAGAEGFVYVGNGVHGIGDLEPADDDWRNPVARVHVERVR